MHFSPIAGSIGAEVSGLELAQPIGTEEALALRAGLARHQALFFRDQALSPDNHRALAEVFGKTQPHPAYPTPEGYPELSILEVTEDAPPKIDSWHTDMTFMRSPPLGSILHGEIIPAYGGDTLFASCTRAYETLHVGMQQMLIGLQAEHSFAHGFRHSLAESGGNPRWMRTVQDNPPCHHPVVRTHPVTEKRALFVNSLFTTRIVGMIESQSDSLLRTLFAHIVLPEHTCRFRWYRNSTAIWDNRATQHRPINDFWPAHRRMRRITVAGDVPK